jgi:hypothetical protein
MKLILLEIYFFAQVPLVWYLFKRFAKRDVLGEMTAGVIIGAFNEFATAPLWAYHFRINIYKTTPLAVVLGWGVLFALVVFASEKLYQFLFKKPLTDIRDKRILLCDVVCAAAIAFPVETLSMRLGIWDYHYELLKWDWGTVPFFNMPYEALFGYCLLMLVGPSFVRLWERPFERAMEKPL